MYARSIQWNYDRFPMMKRPLSFLSSIKFKSSYVCIWRMCVLRARVCVYGNTDEVLLADLPLSE